MKSLALASQRMSHPYLQAHPPPHLAAIQGRSRYRGYLPSIFRGFLPAITGAVKIGTCGTNTRNRNHAGYFPARPYHDMDVA